MLPKEELKQRRTSFWTSLDSEMKSIRGVHGNKVNWLGMKSHVKDLFFRMEFDGTGCRLCLDLQHRDDSIRSLFLDQFIELKAVMQDSFQHPILFLDEYTIPSSNLLVSRIMIEQAELNFFHDNDLEPAKEFLKNQLVSLESFWSEFKDIFIGLQN